MYLFIRYDMHTLHVKQETTESWFELFGLYDSNSLRTNSR